MGRCRGIKPRAVFCVSVALLLQSLAPPGYMAGSIDAGWPVILCPEGLPAGFLAHGEHGHHHDETGGGEDVSIDGHCPLGSVLDASTSLAPLQTAIVHSQSGHGRSSIRCTPAGAAGFHSFRPRTTGLIPTLIQNSQRIQHLQPW